MDPNIVFILVKWSGAPEASTMLVHKSKSKVQHKGVNLWHPISVAMNDCKITSRLAPGFADQCTEVTIIITCTSDKGEQVPRLIMKCMDSVKHINRYFLRMVTRIPKVTSDLHDPWPCIRVNLVSMWHFILKVCAFFLKCKISWQHHDLLEGPLENENALKSLVCCGLPQWPVKGKLGYGCEVPCRQANLVCCSLLQWPVRTQ